MDQRRVLVVKDLASLDSGGFLLISVTTVRADWIQLLNERSSRVLFARSVVLRVVLIFSSHRIQDLDTLLAFALVLSPYLTSSFRWLTYVLKGLNVFPRCRAGHMASSVSTC